MNPARLGARTTATAIVDRLAAPNAAGPDGWWNQSLAKGAAGVALLHIEYAHTGRAGWDTAHAWLAAATQENVSVGANAGLFFGAPAVAFALQAASGGQGRYERALATLDAGIVAMARRRLAAAHARLDRAERPRFAEWDLIYGLTGVGAYLLRRDRHGDVLRQVLAYLVRLSEPAPANGENIPGWWADTDPAGKLSRAFDGGHGNLGMAHGISGPLALLSLAMRRGIVVDGHIDAISRICSWLDTWRQDYDSGSWWPQWITREERRSGRIKQLRPLRPSWCYGTPGLARAQQLAGIATGDQARQHLAPKRCSTASSISANSAKSRTTAYATAGRDCSKPPGASTRTR